MKLIFDRRRHVLTIIPREGMTSQWPAYNNTDSRSRGPWPPGVFQAEQLVHVDGPDGEPGGRFGEWFLRFAVLDRDGVPDDVDLGGDGLPDRNDGPGEGLGIHAGHEGQADGCGRTGAAYATMGCIRTTRQGMAAVAGWWQQDNEATLTVEG